MTPSWVKIRRHPLTWLSLLSVLIAAFLIVRDLRSCSIIVYNKTAEAREEVQVSVGPSAFRFGRLESGESRRVPVPPHTPAGRLLVSWLGCPRGEGIEADFSPATGLRLVVRIEEGNYVSHDEQESIWRRLSQTLP
jgi:hypothetical protein